MEDQTFTPMAKVARVGTLDDQPKDVAYWRTQPPEARLAALEEIRREYHLWRYNEAYPRLQRVCRVIKRA